MPLADDQEPFLTFQIVGGDIDQFHVARYRGTEGLCQLSRFEIDLVSLENDQDLEAIVGTEAKLHVRTGFGERWFHGLISRFETVDESRSAAWFRAELVSRLWLLTHRYQSRIFQAKSVPDILQQVFTSAGLSSDHFRLSLQQTYEPREYCVQYRETDYNFACRLMEAEGIWWYFEHTEDNHVLVLADAVAEYKPIPDGAATLQFVPPGGLVEDEAHVYRFRRIHGLRPGAVRLGDFNFEKPALKLESKSDLGRSAGMEFSDFPGEYATQARGTALAKLRTEEFEAGRITAVGRSDCARLAPARTFNLSQHPTAGLNGSYLVTCATYAGKEPTMGSSGVMVVLTSVLDPQLRQRLLGQENQNPQTQAIVEAILQLSNRLGPMDPTNRRSVTSWLYHAGQIVRESGVAAHAVGGNPLAALAVPGLLADVDLAGSADWNVTAYDCRFECVPSSVVFRAPRITPWPDIRGSQTARVVGPSGEEIYTDQYGRVKVQFPWDLAGKFDEKSSCWIRVAQGSAAGQYGMLFLPRVGQEVVVDFLEGNPDKPIVVGRVFNADHMPPYTLPDNKTRSVIKTNSSKGGGGTNEIRFEDLKDSEQLLIHAQKDLHIRVLKGEQRHNVEKSSHLNVKEEQRAKVGKHRSVDVGGKDALHVKETRNVVVDGDVLEDFKSNHGHKVASQYYIKANQLVVEADAGISFKVGGNFVVIDSTGVSVKGSMINLNSGGSALSKSVNGSPASPAEPDEADQVEPGKDKNYSGEPEELPPIKPKPYKGHWISIDLKDKEGKPVAGEYFEITKPSGKKMCGTLDVNGFARLWVDEPGQCQVCYPNLDAAEWQPG